MAELLPGTVAPKRTTVTPGGITPQVYQGRAAMLADALQRSQQAQPQDIGGQIGEALNRVGTSYMMGVNDRAADAERSSANDRARAVLAARLAGQPLPPDAIDVIGSEWVDPGLQGVVGDLYAQQFDPAETELVQAVGPDGTMQWVNKADAAGMQSALPEAPKAAPMREIGDGRGGIIQQELQPDGTWKQIGAKAQFAPDQSGGENYGLQLYYTKDANGQLHAWQPGRNGQPIEVPLPEGQAFAPGVDYLNTGTAFVPVDRRGAALDTNAPGVAPVPIDVAGKQSAEVQGTAQGQAVVDLPNTLAKAAETHQVINQLRNHPGRRQATGGTAILPILPGTAAKDFDVLLQQARGGVFLQAYQQLKGGGAITNIEGEKGEQAIARLDRAQTEAEFLSALDDLDAVISAGEARMKQRAGQPVAAPEDRPALAPRGSNIVNQLPPGFN